MNKETLIRRVAEATENTLVNTQNVIDAMLFMIVTELKEGGEVNITNFGKFETFLRKDRAVRDLWTKKIIRTGDVLTPKFRASETLKKILK